MAHDPLSGPALYADVVTYAGFGDHRTGTPAEAATTDWLSDQLRTAGYQLERQPFGLPVFDLEDASVEVGGRRLNAFPLWTPQAGEAVGPLSLEARPGAIAVLSFAVGVGAALGASEAWRRPVAAALASGAAGVVAVTENPLGELVAFNAPPAQAPWEAPVLAIAGRDGAFLLDSARAGASARLTLAGRMRAAASDNLIARSPGPGRPLIVSTPKSGWFACAGERGSGIAIWLGLARHFVGQGRNLIFMAASGHEFDGYGGHLFAEALAPPPGAAAGWVHIGANVAAYDATLQDGRPVRGAAPQPARRLAVSEPLLAVARAAFAGQPAYEAAVDIDAFGAAGEIAEYRRRGYRPLVGLVGGHPLHHTRRDQPDMTGPELLEPVARGLAALIGELCAKSELPSG